MAKKAKLDKILASLEDWCRNAPNEERLPGPLGSILTAKKELAKLRKKPDIRYAKDPTNG